ncbi:MAG: hypothetical protein Q8L84_12930 [Hyphomonas sp.]|nr:hypothetical protein [Hyphomonas sp.]
MAVAPSAWAHTPSVMSSATSLTVMGPRSRPSSLRMAKNATSPITVAIPRAASGSASVRARVSNPLSPS